MNFLHKVSISAKVQPIFPEQKSMERLQLTLLITAAGFALILPTFGNLKITIKSEQDTQASSTTNSGGK